MNSSFYFNNLTSDIILLYEDNKTKINNNYDIKDFFPDFILKQDFSYFYGNKNYEIIDSTSLFRLIFDNNIAYLKETIDNSLKNFIIDLAKLKINNSDIKYNEDSFKQKILISFSKLNLFPKILFFLFESNFF